MIPCWFEEGPGLAHTILSPPDVPFWSAAADDATRRRWCRLGAEGAASVEEERMYKILGAILVAALVADFIWVIRTALSVH